MVVTTNAMHKATTPRVSVETPPRVGLARALVVLGLVAATVWWFSWTALHSILSETRSEGIGAALVDDSTVQAEVKRQVRDGMYLSGATSLGFTEQDLDEAARAVAADPAVGRRHALHALPAAIGG